MQDKAQLGMQANLRRQSEVLAQHVEQLRVQLREAELTAAAAMDEEKALHAAQIVALEGDKETLRSASPLLKCVFQCSPVLEHRALLHTDLRFGVY